MNASSGLVLLDTNIVIHVLRNDVLGTRVSADQSLTTRPDKPLISVVAVGECLAFARKRSWGDAKTKRLVELLRNFVVVDINSSTVLDEYATIDVWCQTHGRSLAQNDLWIAATCSAAGAHLLTTDKDFDPLHEVFFSRTFYDPKTPVVA